MKRKPMISARGGSHRWTQTTRQYVAVHQVCWLRFPRCTIRATSIDHYIPQKYRPDLAEDPNNFRPACLYCQRARRATPPHLIPALRVKLEAAATRQQRSRRALGFFN